MSSKTKAKRFETGVFKLALAFGLAVSVSAVSGTIPPIDLKVTYQRGLVEELYTLKINNRSFRFLNGEESTVFKIQDCNRSLVRRFIKRLDLNGRRSPARKSVVKRSRANNHLVSAVSGRRAQHFRSDSLTGIRLRDLPNSVFILSIRQKNLCKR